MLVAIPHIGFFKGIPAALEQVNDHMIDTSNDRRITSLFTGGSHHRNLSAFYRAESISSGEGIRSMSQNGHFLVLFKNPRDK